MASKTLRVGLTGGIGSGKSTVANILAELGASVIDADAISRNTTTPHGSAIEAIKHAFGAAFITTQNSLNRDQMRALIFNDSGAKERLEAIIHPLVKFEMQQQFLAAERTGASLVVYDIPLLAESAHWRQELHRIVVIDCGPETQIQRVMTRNSLARTHIEQIIASQATRAKRLSVADVIIFNENINLDQLHVEVAQIAHFFGL